MGEPLHPERIGRYEIILPIASGGMATVYLGRVEGLGGFGRYVAVKLTREGLSSDPEFADHLIEEAKLVAQLRHPNVVPVLDVGESERGVYLVMEYIPGDALQGLIRQGREHGPPLPTRVGLRVLVDALAGLHAAHEHESEDGAPLHVVHRDFSPHNILVGTDGIARLTDFGIAKAASRASTTIAGTIKGKISYVAPEQARGVALDRRADIWSAGVIAWELLAGKKLFGTDQRALLDIVGGEPPRVASTGADVPPALADAIAHALERDPGARTATAAIFARELATAAKDAGMLAEHAEVAEQVARLAGPTLAERKAQMATVRQTRSAATPITTTIGLPALDTVRVTLPSLPSLPDLPEASASIDVSLDEPTARDPFELPGATVLGPVPSPFAPPAPSRAATILRNVRAALEPALAQLEPTLARLTSTQKAVAGGGIGVVALAITILAVTCGGGAKPADGLATTSGSASASTVSALVPLTPPTSTITPTTPDPSPADPGAWAPMLELTADAPIALVRIEGRSTELPLPTPRLNIELEPGEEGKELHLVVQSSDNRVVTTTARPGGTVAISFATAPIAPPAPRPPVRKPPVITKKRTR